MKKVLLITIFILLSGCIERPLETRDTRELLGTVVRISVIGDEKNLDETIDLAFQEIKRVDDLMSTYKNSSELSVLNNNSILINASDELIYNIERAVYYSNLSNGAFDVTVKPILDLYSRSFNEKQRPPTEEEIQETLKLVGYKRIRIDGRNISLQSGMQLTLGGIAKGYAVDTAIEVLKENGIENALVNAGGDIRALGDKKGDGWKVALENPRNREEYIAIIKLDNKAVATSGDYERYFDPDRRFHHIVDPGTGYSALSLISATVIADKTIDADALATAVFVLGPEKGLGLVEGMEGVEALLITNNRTIIRSSGFSTYEA